jgi:hypothetical protein
MIYILKLRKIQIFLRSVNDMEITGEVSNSQRHKASRLSGTQDPQHPDSCRDQRACLLPGLGNCIADGTYKSEWHNRRS